MWEPQDPETIQLQATQGVRDKARACTASFSLKVHFPQEARDLPFYKTGHNDQASHALSVLYLAFTATTSSPVMSQISVCSKFFLQPSLLTPSFYLHACRVKRQVLRAYGIVRAVHFAF